jgi:predicted porin
MVHNSSTRATAITGGLANTAGTTGSRNASSINTGLLPAWIGFTGTTRQNDLDVSFTISIQPGASNTGALSGGLANYGVGEQRQTFMTIGDKSWGSFKLGKDLGIFGSDAILNDMTLLGVGSQGVVGTAGGTTTTLGGIGSGYIYADWKGQLSYTTPNMNGFQATVGLMQPWNATSAGTSANSGVSATGSKQRMYGYEGKASYSFSANDVNGKIWVGGISQKANDVYAIGNSPTAYAGEVGASVSAGIVSVVGYYYAGEGAGTTGFLRDGHSVTGKKRDSDGGYIQATIKLPSQTKVGIAYGVSNLDRGEGDTSTTDIVKENERYTAGLYHPLTKHLNLVAEYTHIEAKSNNAAAADNKSNIGSVGAILFF